MQPLRPSRLALGISFGIALLWLVFGVYHLLFGPVASPVPSFGYLATCALSLAAPFFYRRFRSWSPWSPWPRYGYTALLVVATMFCVLLATIDVAMHYLVATH